MADDRSILFADLEHAAARRDPQFVPWVLEFLAQPDPPAGQPEDPPDDYQAQPLPPDAWSLDRLRQSLNPQALASKTDDERQATRTGAWARIEQNPGNVEYWLPDSNGAIRVALETRPGTARTLFRAEPNGPWTPLPGMDWNDTERAIRSLHSKIRNILPQRTP